MPVIILSDGQPVTVRRLGIFDLDGVGPELLGPFRYAITLANGTQVEETYDLTKFSKPPAHPGVPEETIVERSPQWWQLLEWETYKAAVAHEKKRLDSAVAYVLAVSAFIADTCISADDKQRILDDADWAAIYSAALVPQVTPDLLATAFKDHFSASFKELEIFDALKRIAKGHGSYDTIRVHEINALNESGMTETQWADLSLAERTRRVAAKMLPKMMETLESDQAIKEAKKKSG